MSTGTHTAGPWEPSGSLHWPDNPDEPDNPCEFASIWTAHGRRAHRKRICTVERRRKEYEANARLIAAAPEMLEALREAWRYLNEEPTIRHPLERMQINATLRAAIAKAEGR